MHTKEWVAMVTTDQAFEIPSIGPTLEMIKQIAEKLQEQLNEMGIARSPVKQFLHLFASGTKERTKLEDFVRRMANAKIDLIVRIQLELIGLNRNMQAAVKLSVERIVALDARLSEHSGIGNYPKLAKLLSNHRQNTDGTITVTKEDLEDLLLQEGVALQSEKGERAKKDISDNIIGKKAFVIAGPLGEDIWEDADVSITRNIVDEGGYAILHGQKNGMEVLKIMAETRVREAEAENSGRRN